MNIIKFLCINSLFLFSCTLFTMQERASSKIKYINDNPKTIVLFQGLFTIPFFLNNMKNSKNVTHAIKKTRYIPFLSFIAACSYLSIQEDNINTKKIYSNRFDNFKKD